MPACGPASSPKQIGITRLGAAAGDALGGVTSLMAAGARVTDFTVLRQLDGAADLTSCAALADRAAIFGVGDVLHPGHVLAVQRLVHRHVNHARGRDRKSTRLNSSHMSISYAVFCL